MSTHSDGIFASSAPAYLDAGWGCVLHLPYGRKETPPTGYSGNDHPDTPRELVMRWARQNPNGNIAVAIPKGVIGIDVDHYDKTSKTGKVEVKRGGDNLVELEAQWGKLPNSWRCTSREAPNGIRLYRVPEGLRFVGKWGNGLDIIQNHHRYVVIAPSIHPDTQKPYVWYGPDGQPSDIPVIAELPALPETWVRGLMKANQHRTLPGSAADSASMHAAISVDDRELCGHMARLVTRTQDELASADSGSRHDTALENTMRLVGAAADGHTGAEEALELAKEAWDEATAGEDRGEEWEKLVNGAAAQAAGALSSGTPKTIDPCDGGSGLGITVLTPVGREDSYVAPEATEQPEPIEPIEPPAPGITAVGASDTARFDTTLIVLGADNAEAIQPHLKETTQLLAIEGRESWRDENGIPMSALRATKDTQVVILFGPEVSSDLATYNSAMALKHACEGIGASVATFTQPPGVTGASVGAYLRAQEEQDRLGIVARMLSKVTDKPSSTKPKNSRNFNGQDPLQELELNDLALGTGWADDHRSDFRWVTEDKTWIAFRQGRWSPDGAESHVNSSVMEYVAEIGAPLQVAQHACKASDPEQSEAYRNAYTALVSHRKRGNVRDTAGAYSQMHVSSNDLDSHPAIWCASNANINLRTLEVMPHDSGLLLTMGSGVAFDAKAQCPRFDQFLAEALPDADVREYVLRLFAMSMHGQVYEHIFPVFIGSGRNGKGTLLRVMNAIFGELGVVLDPRSLLVTKFEQHNEEIAQLHKKRLATTEEPTKGSKWNAARIKAWTGGDSLKGSFKGKRLFEFKPSHTLIMASNDKPEVDLGEDGSFWARYKEIPFRVSFEGREDTALEPYIHKHELPGVLNRLLEAADRYNQNGLEYEPAAVKQTTSATRHESNYMKGFVEDCLTWTGKRGDYAIISDVHMAAGKWWADNGIEQKMPAMQRGKFKEALGAALGVDLADPTIEGRLSSPKRERAWFGMRLEGATSNWSDDQPLLVALSDAKESSNEATTVGDEGNPKSDQYRPDSDQYQVPDSSYWSNTKDQVTDGPVPVRPVRPVKSHYAQSHTRETQETSVDQEKEVCVPGVVKPHSELLVILVGNDLETSKNGDAAPSSAEVRPAAPPTPIAPVSKSPSGTVTNMVETTACTGCGRTIGAAGAARNGGLCGKCKNS